MIRLELCMYYLLLVLALVLVGCSSTPEVEVTPTNNVPLADTQSYNTSQDTPLVLTLSGTDPDGDTLLYTVTQQPSNGTLGAIDQASGEVIYTPTSGFSGEDTFTYTVSDDTTTSAEATVTISVTRSNTGPTATNQTLSTSENTPLTLTLTGNDPDGDALTFTIIQQPSLGRLESIDQETGSVLYKPTEGASGQDSFTFVVSDGANISAEATITISIDNVNDAPTATPQARSTPGNTALQLTLTGSDPENAELSFAIVASPSKGNLSDIDQTTGEVTYTPKQGESGEDSFSFTVSDGVNTSEPATVSITIGIVNRAPVAEDLSLEVREDYAPLSVNLRGTDADGDYVRYIVVEEPAHGRIYGNLPNLTYRPDKDYNGQDKLTYRVTDRTDDSNLATVSITVTPSNDSPVLIGLSNSTIPENQPAGTLVGTLSATDVDGDTLIYTLNGSSGNYNFIIEGDQLKTARPFDFESGESLGVRIKVEDEVGSWDDDGFSITVTDEVGETHVVTSAADNGAGSLRQTVADVKSDDTISFDPNLSGQTITLTGGPIAITEDIIVSGPSQNSLSIDGNGESQLFVIEPSARVTLENLTLTNGYGEQGGAIHNRGNLTLQGDLRITNSVAHEGGGVFSTSSLTLRDSVTIANNSAESGGGIRSGGGLRMWGNASVTSNAAQVEGGGVYSQGYVGLHEYASVTNNQADDAGGVYSGGSTALYDYATIAGNTARGIGGGVMQIALFDSLKLRDNSSISGNTAGNGGGVFYILGGVFSIRGDAHISNNTALRGLGGGVYLYEETETEGIIEGDTVLNNAPDDIYRDSD